MDLSRSGECQDDVLRCADAWGSGAPSSTAGGKLFPCGLNRPERGRPSINEVENGWSYITYLLSFRDVDRLSFTFTFTSSRCTCKLECTLKHYCVAQFDLHKKEGKLQQHTEQDVAGRLTSVTVFMKD